ncbi:copper amine oxidase N-terminal domain-containing protein [Paenibacillus turpanensis]|uniref:copper amine oxidase N-terminal domain-containing protein n=1 Tax=Paenibacillus turpanensis TaxID=2689078 RepID=UPI00140E2517|nr:copper amine oxidase N-terminal domain-containing protein [Paenibacillus turpanensis]
MKRTWKRSLFLASLIGLSFSAGVLADNGVTKVEAFLRKDFTIALDGQPLQLEKPPLIYDNRTYLPLTVLSKLLDIDVNWDASTSTVYVNSRFDGQPENPNSAGQVYAQIELNMLQAYSAKYLGGEYQVLTNTYDSVQYYRVSDMERMGIDCRGIAKVQEKYTKALYATEAELAKVWKEKPTFSYIYDTMIAGETNEDIIAVLKSEAKTVLLASSYWGSGSYGRGGGMIYTIDKVPFPGQNEYHLLSYEMGHFYVYEMKLSQDKDGKWHSTGYSKVDIQPNVQLDPRYTR